MKSALFLLLAAALPARADHDAHEEHPAQYSADFLAGAVGARAAGMGEAATAAVNDAGAIHWNPAALTRVEKRSATFMHAGAVGDATMDFGAYAQNLGEKVGALALSVHYQSAGRITGTDENGAEIRGPAPSDLAIGLGYAYKLGAIVPGLSLGVGGKFVRSTLVDSAQTFTFDAGILSPALFSGKLRLGASLGNVGGALKYGETAEPLRRVGRLGAAFQPTADWTLASDLSWAAGESVAIGAGLEYWMRATGDWRVAPRAGYRARTEYGFEALDGATAGIGIASAKFGIDYGLAPFFPTGIEHRLSLSMKF